MPTKEAPQLLNLHEALHSDQLLTFREAATILRISAHACWRLSKQGKLPTVRIGRSIRFRPGAIAPFISRREIPVKR